MITLTINSTTYNLPTNSKEIDLRTYLTARHSKSISTATGIPESILTKLTPEMQRTITDFVAWVFDDSWDVAYRPLAYSKDIADETWGKLEQARKIIISDSPTAALEVYKTYTGQDVSERTVYDYIHPITALLEKILTFVKENRLPESKYEDDEIEAGIKGIESFGIFNTIDALAGGDPIRYDEIMKQPAGVVMMKLRHNYEVNRYKGRLYDIKKQNSELMSKAKRK